MRLYGVTSGPHFPVFGLNTERYFAFGHFSRGVTAYSVDQVFHNVAVVEETVIFSSQTINDQYKSNISELRSSCLGGVL